MTPPSIVRRGIGHVTASVDGSALVVGFIASLVVLVATAVHLAIVTVRTAWDDIASLGGRSDPTYDLILYAESGGSLTLGSDWLTWPYLLPDHDRQRERGEGRRDHC